MPPKKIDTLELLGKLIPAGEPAERDAVHIAVAPVIAAENLLHGAHVGMLSNGEASTKADTLIGIVDPFLQYRIKAGSRFWLYLYPATITSLRHHWTHPAFSNEEQEEQEEQPSKEMIAARRRARGLVEHPESVRKLEQMADKYGVTFDTLVEAAVSGEGCCFSDDLDYPDFEGSFWKHVENVSGQRFSASHRENTTFRCTC